MSRTSHIRHRAQRRRLALCLSATGTPDTMPEPVLYAWLIEADRAGERESAERAQREILRRMGIGEPR